MQNEKRSVSCYATAGTELTKESAETPRSSARRVTRGFDGFTRIRLISRPFIFFVAFSKLSSSQRSHCFFNEDLDFMSPFFYVS